MGTGMPPVVFRDKRNLRLLLGGYPAKLKKVLIVTAPLWFKAPFKILRLFVREKLRERVYTVSVAQLLTHIPRESLPTQLGGSLILDHNGWLSFCMQSMTAREESPLPQYDGKTPSPQKRIRTPTEIEISSSTNNINVDSWTEEGNLNPPSSASSGFSDDDSLHGDGAALTMPQLVDYVRDRGRSGLMQEYAEIRSRPPDGTFNVAKMKNNLPKNRYTDVLCYDHSRVILSEIDSDKDSDYIHANFVDGYKQKNAFINTQGPLPKTTNEFWRMIWEQHTLVIVMTTRVMERGRPKCHQYWETEAGGEATYGQFTVKTIAVEPDPDYTVTTINLINNKGGYPAKLKKVLIVTAPLWFKAPFKILRLFVREKLRERVYTVSVAQLLTHIPRESLPTQLGGSLILDHNGWLSFCMQSMTAREESPLPQYDGKTPSPQKRIRTPTEIEISSSTNNINVDSWTEEGNLNPPSSASSGFSDDDSLHGDGAALTMPQLVDYVRDRGRSGLMQEYAEIRSRPPDGTFNVAKMKNNLPKNRYTDVLCYDHSRVILSEIDSDKDSDYIHANFVDGYKQKNAFINTQGPLPKTTNEFWRMIWEQHTLVIVMTTRVMERGRPKCHQYWETEAGGEATYGQFTVKTIAVEPDPDYTVTTINLINNKTDESREVSHWQFTSWPDYGVPRSAKAMLEFLERVRRKQNAMVVALGDTWAGHPRGPPIVVHCSAGIGRTGTFCTLDICISRLEDLGTADIRGTVERIRSQRAYSIQMPDQYIFCHLALIEYALMKGHLQSADLTGFDPGADDDSD
ncbi:hypothetical protein Zmor_000265 [Zophobas morio]|uniref:Tyrosine-protein phosphatase non-receptor type 9 n=1 Tax=Zophobas morio TaxID=2755281 RepID=A0AA38MR37_9CUCU|nr:hypothetical protein Zmor_000265 [Zophobas morio]